MSDHLLNFHEAADVLGVSVPMVKKLRYQGKLSSRKIGERVLFDKRDIAEFIDNSRAEAWYYGEAE